MRTPKVVGHFITACVLAAATAASSDSLKGATGTVMEANPVRLATGHIATQSLVALDNGASVWVTQPGGVMSGFRTTVFPSLPLLAQGQRVALSGDVRALPDGRYRLQPSAVAILSNEGAPTLPFVNNTSSSGSRLHWAANCVYVTYDQAGTEQIAGDAEFSVMDAALAAWTDGAAGCSYLSFVTERKPGLEVAVDGINLIKFRDTKWCVPATDDAPEECLLDGIAALTWLQSVDDPGGDRDGEIVDADIQINGENFAIATGGVTLGTATCLSDLGNVITHEIGHLLGLGHTCRTNGEAPSVDDTGAPGPLCVQTSDAALLDATMAAGQDCGETKKSSLEPDDIDAICVNYASSDDPGSCERADLGNKGCCSANDSPSSMLLGLFVAALLYRRRAAHCE